MAVNPNITFVLGTRPEIIKLAPVIRCCEQRGISYSILHTGQHYSEELDAVFFDQLELPSPDHNLAVGSGRHGHQTGRMLAGIEEILLEEDPGVVLVQGDTNSVLAGSLAVSKLEMPVGHVEAGLRSFDREMPEEINRLLADHIGEYLFAPTETSRDYLREEGIDDDRIYVTGNTIVDAVHQHRELAEAKSTICERLEIQPGEFGVMTAHRAENVDDRERFEQLLAGVGQVATANKLGIIYPIHPRAQKRLSEFELSVPDSIRVIDPLKYLDFLKLQVNAALILTDSGGIQEEASILGVPCVTLRDNTERPETLDVGANELAGVDPDAIVASADRMLAADHEWTTPYGDGHTADRILEILSAETDLTA